MEFRHSLGRDLRFAVRHMRQAPMVTAVAMASLALGIGANVAIFSLVNALILKSLPIEAPEQLVLLGRDDARAPGGGPSTSFTHPQFEALRDEGRIFDRVMAVGFARFNLNSAGEARIVPGLYVSSGFLDTLGVTPAIGRDFTASDDRRGAPDGPVALISHGFWQRQYGGDPAVLGQAMTLDGHPFTIVGVTPPDFFGVRVGLTFDVMIPVGSEPIIRGPESSLDRRTSWWLTIFGRLAPPDTAAAAEARLEAFRPQWREATMPADYRAEDQSQYLTERMVLAPAGAGISSLRERYSQALFVLLGIVGLVLAIACGNMANLLLAQSAARRKELSVMLSLGASRMLLVRQTIIESLLLSTVGAAAGLLVAAWGSRALVAMLSTRTSTVALDLSMDWRVFTFTATVGAVTGLLFGAIPAVRGTSVAPAGALRQASRGVVRGGGRLQFGHGLVALQVALSFVLVFASILFVRTFVGLTTQGMGFESEHVLLATVDLRRTAVAESGRLPIFERIREAVAAAPGVAAAAGSFVTPVSGSTWNLLVAVPGYTGPERDRGSLFNAVTPDYFRAMGTPVLTGRGFTDADLAGRPQVMVVNEAFADRFFLGQNPVGRTFVLEAFGRDRKDTPVEIVGLVANAKYRSLREQPQPTMYGSLAQQDRISSSIRMVIKTVGRPWDVRSIVVNAVTGVNKDVVLDLKTLDEDLGAAVQGERLIASLSAAFGMLALLLATLGLFGMMSYSVTRRRSEIGIRIALGAAPSAITRMVLGHVALITAIGLAAGAAGAVGAGRFVNALLFNLSANDETMIALTAVTLAVAAGIAGYMPARKAARIDPMMALRDD
jgi:putative ABC transport system permease protein